MKLFFYILLLALGLSSVGVAPGVADMIGHGWGGSGGSSGGWGHGGFGGGGGAPAPEIGAGVLGMLLAGGVAYNIRRRARD
jgi:hypothetical protein